MTNHKCKWVTPFCHLGVKLYDIIMLRNYCVKLFNGVAWWNSGWHCCLTPRKSTVWIQAGAFLFKICMSSMCLHGFNPVICMGEDEYIWVYMYGGRLIGDSELGKGVIVSMNSCLPFWVRTTTAWWPVQVLPCLLLHVSWDGLSLRCPWRKVEGNWCVSTKLYIL